MKMAIRVFLITVALFVTVAGHAPAADSKQEFSGVVDKVMDGGLIRVTLGEGQKIPESYRRCSKVYSTMAWVHLYAVGAPDLLKKQVCAKDAKEFVRSLTQGKRVKVEVTGCPPDGGLTGVVTVEDGFVASKNISVELIKAGLVKVQLPGASKSGGSLSNKYFEAEKTAMMEGRGLWGKKTCGRK